MASPVTSVAIRLGIEGDGEVETKHKALGDSGEKAFDGIATSASRASAATDQATAALDKQAAKYERLAAVARAAALADTSQRNVNAMLGVMAPNSGAAKESASVFALAAQAEEELARRTEQLRAQIDPLYAAQQRLNRAEQEANILFTAGTITTKEHTLALTRARQAYADSEQMITRYAGSHRLAAHEITNLTYQLNDVVVSLASGQAPMMVMMQQGAQIGQILGSRPGGVAGGLAAVLTFINPVYLGLATVAAGFALAGAAAYSYDASQRRMQVAAEGLGRIAGTTGDELEALAQATAKSADMSVSGARKFETALVETGKINTAVLGPATKMAKDYAAVMGMDLPAAGKDLAAKLADPARGVVELNEKLGIWNDSTMRNIQLLAQQGDKTAAQTTLIRELAEGIKGASDRTRGWARYWDEVTTAASNAYDAMGKAVDRALGGGPASELIANLQRQRANTVAGLNVAPNLVPQELARIDAAIAKLQAETRGSLTARANAAAASAGQSANRQLGIDQRDNLSTQLNTYLKATASGSSSFSPEGWRNVQTAIEQNRRALDSWLPPAQKAVKIREAEAVLERARTPAAKAAAAADLERVKASGELATRADVEGRAMAAADKARTQAARSGEGHRSSILREAQAMEVNATQALRLASAYLAGDAAALQAEARRKALTDATRRGTDTEAQAQRQLALMIAETAVTGAKSVADMMARVEGQKAVNDAVAAGTMSAAEANRQLQTAQALHPLLIAASVAEGEAKGRLTEVIQRLRAAYAAVNVEQARAQIQQSNASADERIAQMQLEARMADDLTGARERAIAALKATQENKRLGLDPASPDAKSNVDRQQQLADQDGATRRAQYIAQTVRNQQFGLELAQAELGLIGASAERHDQVINRIRTIQDLRLHNIDLASAEGQKILEQGAHWDEVARHVQNLQADWNEVVNFGSNFVDTVLSPSNWDNWGDAGKRILADLGNEFLKLAVLNPIKNQLFGLGLPTIGSVAANLIGHNALGTDYWPGGLSVVGEHGPEIRYMPRGSQVKDAARTRQLMSGGGGEPGVVVNMPITLNAQGSGPSEVQALKAEVDELKRSLPAKIVSTVSDARARRIIP
jgi:hypothetical protein